MMAALTANDPLFQPGFEDADTAIAAGFVPLRLLRLARRRRAPAFRPAPLRHADRSPLVHRARRPRHLHPGRGRAPSRRAASALTSLRPVVYAELPGAQHSFDLFHSIRFERVIDAIEAFAGGSALHVALTPPEGRGPR